MDPQTIGTVGLVVFAVWFPTLTLVAVYLFRRLRLEERLKAIEHGRSIVFDPEVSAARTRRAGLVLVAAGIGAGLADAIITSVLGVEELLAFLAVAAVLLLIGLGLLLDYRLQRGDIRRRTSHRSTEDVHQ
jgi:hypothetical protein